MPRVQQVPVVSTPVGKTTATGDISRTQNNRPTAPGPSCAQAAEPGMHHPGIPPYPGLKRRQSSHQDLTALAGGAPPPPAAGAPGAGAPPLPPQLRRVSAASTSGAGGGSGSPQCSPLLSPMGQSERAASGMSALHLGPSSAGPPATAGSSLSPRGSAAAGPSGAKLFVVANGQGSPCLDLSRVPNMLADATVGCDLLVIEGMGRAVHTNLRATFKWVWALGWAAGCMRWACV